MADTGAPRPITVDEAIAIVEASGAGLKLEMAIVGQYRRPGRPRQFSVLALLVGMMLNASEGSAMLNRIAPKLNALHRTERKQLGITRSQVITTRQVNRCFNLVVAALGGQAGLDRLYDMILPGSAPEEVALTSSIAVDASDIESYSTGRSINDIKGLFSDRDARWKAKGAQSPWKKPIFGYELTTAITVPDMNGEPVPHIVKAARFRPATVATVLAGLEVVTAITAQQDRLGDVHIDRGYTKANDGHELILPIHALGGTPIFDLCERQRGVTGTVHGALIIDGNPFSPACPVHLHNIEPPGLNAPLDKVVAYQAKIAERGVYALVQHGSTHPDGSRDYLCPAHAGNVACPLVPNPNLSAAKQKRNLLPALAAPATALANSVCSQKFKRFAATDIPLAQSELFGSAEWKAAYDRRGRVEGGYSNLKNEATTNIKRGTIRVMGLVKTGIMVLMAQAVTNVRLGHAYRTSKRATQGSKSDRVPKRRGRPPKKPLSTFVPRYVLQPGTGGPP